MVRSIVFTIMLVSIFALGFGAESAPGRVAATDGVIVVIPNGDPILIGVARDAEGPAIEIGEGQLNATRMAIDDYGPIQGFTVMAKDWNAGCNEVSAVEAANEVVADPAHLGVIGHTCSGSMAAGLPIYEAATIVAISGTATSVGLPGEGPTVFNRTIVDDLNGPDAFSEKVRGQPQWDDWAQAYDDFNSANPGGGSAGTLGANGAPPQFAEFAYDAAMLLLTRIDEVATVSVEGDLVVNRSVLAAAVRNTTDFRGVTCDITIEANGDRAPELADLTPCDPVGQPVIWGDNNCSGSADPIDSLLTLRFDAGLPTNTGDCPAFGASVHVEVTVGRVPAAGPQGGDTNLMWGDIDCTLAINPIDSLKLLRFDAGLPVSQEAGCSLLGANVAVVPLP